MAQPLRDANANVCRIHELARKDDYPNAVREFYDTWADGYDEDVKVRDYPAPATCAQAFNEVMSDKNALIVDCAAGTGKVGEELAKHGFKRIDAVDFSQKCLDISASKGVYERLICDGLGKNKLKGVEDGHYAGLIGVGAVAVGHVAEDAFTEFTRIVQKGGLMVFTIGRIMVEGDAPENDATIDKLEGAVDDLVRKGVWELVDVVDISYFQGHRANMYTIRRL